MADQPAPGVIASAAQVTLGGFFLLAGASVLYTTSNVMRTYPRDADVAAAMQLFAGIALMFWYVLQLFMGSRR